MGSRVEVKRSWFRVRSKRVRVEKRRRVRVRVRVEMGNGKGWGVLGVPVRVDGKGPTMRSTALQHQSQFGD